MWHGSSTCSPSSSSLENASVLGFAPADVLAWLEATHTTSFSLAAAVNLVTDDGLFDEAWTLPLTSDQAAAADASVELELDELGGSYGVPSEMTEGCDTTSLRFNLYFSKEGGPSGELDLVCESVDGDTASVGMDVLAGWGEGEVE